MVLSNIVGQVRIFVTIFHQIQVVHIICANDVFVLAHQLLIASVETS